MSLVHISYARGHYIGQIRPRGCRRWLTVTGRCAKPERAMAKAALRMTGKIKRARVLLIDSSGWYEPRLVMQASR
jgi:hypothetical protein